MKKLMTVGDVARRLGVTPDAVRRWTREGLLGSRRTEGGVRLFTARAVDRFELEHRRRRPSVQTEGG